VKFKSRERDLFALGIARKQRFNAGLLRHKEFKEAL